MIELTLPSVFTEDLLARIPAQRMTINKMMEKGKIISYALSDDRTRLWIITNAESEFEAMEMIADFPIIDFIEHSTCHPLMFHNMVSMLMPISLN